MYLAGEAQERWHNLYSIDDVENGYTYADFKDFVRDAVGDPVNRMLSVTLEYDKIRQREGQTVQQFATELDTLEDQLGDYSEPQRVRHLLAKLQPALRPAIVKYHEIPKTRQELVTLATRIESTDQSAHSKRQLGDPSSQRPPKKNKHMPLEAPVGRKQTAGDTQGRSREGGKKLHPSSEGSQLDGASKVDCRQATPLRGAVETKAGMKDMYFLLDDGADVNVIPQRLALQHQLPRLSHAALPKVNSFAGQQSFCYGAYYARVRLTDSAGVERTTGATFYSFDTAEDVCILGRPWRHRQAVLMDSSTNSWTYSTQSQAARLREP
ncbi:hypothetical protein M409DRAFT_60773 [Zasmidium cellare ATCC 36951]|uniref:Uncharacterized protein n=1 Tax=Zasmidium cellare ATCC 36951 TaxID=1080233 RepID=A0A6A6C0T4_ZASCE|nr:uncharacterized protein M409DRAFT_60773 [Zasmidium cellare ATCC 36951]KAF2159422.1 hypothetical protein M409DRAFT_60773 [Zasmidium cellare ATCC 36951]